MKFLLLGFGLLAATSAQAQIFRPHHDRGGRHHAPRGGTVVSVGIDYSRGGYGHAHGHRGYLPRSYYRGYYAPVVSYYPSYPAYGYYDGYGAGYPYYGSYGHGAYGGSSAANGLVLGALAGGVIGHNSGTLHHNGWRGAAWGAGIGWLLGSIADANRRPATYATAPAVVQTAAPTPATATISATSAPPQQVTIINNYYNNATPMSAANGLFGR